VTKELEYWRRILPAGGVTSVPRWTSSPTPGVARCRATIPAPVADAVRRLAAELVVPPADVVLAAHARVLVALSGERDVVTRYRPAIGAAALPAPLRTDPPTWRALVTDIARHAAALRANAHVEVEALRAELNVPGPVSEVLFNPNISADPTCAHEDLSDGCVLAVGYDPDTDALVVSHRTDALDGMAAARIAGYHLVALALAATKPDTEHSMARLLGADERRLQLQAMSGPARELPDARFHELFERRVAASPDAVAVEQGEIRWTYAELNARANQLGRALLARGLSGEDVVAVVSERTPDWMACVLAVFKAGGAYLPIEPHFPVGRITTTLTRAECRFVLTEPGSTANLDLDSLPGVQVLQVADALGEGHPPTDLGIEVGPDQLAYIYFTSGSTGAPKGAMCEQAGMLNHLLAKINDLGVAEGTAVAQTAPQCFDISLWQLISGLLVGARTVIIPQDVILDVARFVQIVDESKVTVLQIVPSYLDAVLAHLESAPRRLDALRTVSVTGEAVKKELVQRWFDAMPHIAMVNAYGLTETSDDTNHEVMRVVPDADRVPLGPPIPNVTVYVVDEHLQPVPLGAPGEIVFSGVCVGRGYINDPERTAAAFLADPHQPGARLYRSGDHGRWRPDGKLEFLGRRDNQVKVAGFRIEIGEIENRLLQVPGVFDGAVVVVGDTEATKRLVGFYSGPAPLPTELLREHLAMALPGYMVPTVLHHRDQLPLTANSKIDRKALGALAGELDAPTTDREAPVGATEVRVAAAWAQVLDTNLDLIGRGDNFFESGGTSLTAVKLVIALHRQVSLKEVIACPVLTDLARLLDERTAPESAPDLLSAEKSEASSSGN
jgi:amino acid adenylation domain-containing protein